MNPKISIITISFNCKADIEQTITSILNQTYPYPDLEYIIIDGSSTDGTLEIIEKYKNKIDIIISEPDKGIFDAMNKGLKLASGDWVNFMNAGDTFYNNDTLAKIFMAEELNSFGVIYGRTFSNGSIRQPQKLSSLKYGGIMACHQSVFYNREICGEELYYEVKHKHYGDIELTRRLYIKGIPFQEVPVTISNYKGDGFSSTISNAARIAKFYYLYQNMGIKGIWYGIIGKIFFLISKKFIVSTAKIKTKNKS